MMYFFKLIKNLIDLLIIQYHIYIKSNMDLMNSNIEGLGKKMMDLIYPEFKKIQEKFTKELEEKIEEITDEKDSEIEELTTDRDHYYNEKEEMEEKINCIEQTCEEICYDAQWDIDIDDLPIVGWHSQDAIYTVREVYYYLKETIKGLVDKNKKLEEDLEKSQKKNILLEKIVVTLAPKFRDSELLEKGFDINDYEYDNSYEQHVSRFIQQQNKMLKHSTFYTHNKKHVEKVLNLSFTGSKINDIYTCDWEDSRINYVGNKSFNGLLKALDLHNYDVNAQEAIKKICKFHSEEITFGISITLSSGNIVYLTNIGTDY